MAQSPCACINIIKPVLVDVLLKHDVPGASALSIAGIAAATALGNLQFCTQTDGLTRVLTINRKSAGECLNLKIVLWLGVHAVHVKVILAIYYVTVVQFVFLNTVTDNIAVGTWNRLPDYVGLTTILRVTYCHEFGNLLSLHLWCSTEYTQILD